MAHKNVVVAVFCCIILVALAIEGYFFPGSLNWGFHFLGLLPPAYFYCYIAAMLGALLYVLVGSVEKHISIFVPKFLKLPVISVVFVLFLFLLLAFTFRQRVPLLGDSFVLINNYENTFKGLHNLILYREPLAVYYFFFVANQLGLYVYPAIMNAFLVGEFILGIGFILNVVLIAKCFLPDPTARMLSVFFVLTGTYMQVFFGYAEVYSVVLFFVSFYIVVAAFWMRGKLPFFYIPTIFVLQTITHFLSLLLLPSLLVITYYEYKTKGLRNIVIGYLIPCVFSILLLALLHVDLFHLIPSVTHSPFLSVFASKDSFQAYTLFSLYHLIDVFNLWLLLGSSSLILFVLVLLNGRNNLLDSVEKKFFAACTIPIIAFVLLAKFDLGMASDWDVLASFFFLINFFSLATFLTLQVAGKERSFLLCAAITVFQSAVWISVNASEAPTIARTKLLHDKRIVSHEGIYQITYHLEQYYGSRGDIPAIIAMWEDYIQQYPGDGRGYERVTIYRVQNGLEMDPNTMNMIEKWVEIDPQNLRARSTLAKICSNAGVPHLEDGNFEEAELLFRRSIGLDSTAVIAYYNMGDLYAKKGLLDSAIQWYMKAVQIDSTYLPSFDALWYVYTKKGDLQSALGALSRSIGQNPTAPKEYEKIAQIFYRMGDRKSAIENLKKAARLGSQFAQKFLTEQRIAWQSQ